MIFLFIGSYLLAGFLFVWAFNISFAAHLQEKNSAMRNMHLWSYAIVLFAIILVIYAGGIYASR